MFFGGDALDRKNRKVFGGDSAEFERKEMPKKTTITFRIYQLPQANAARSNTHMTIHPRYAVCTGTGYMLHKHPYYCGCVDLGVYTYDIQPIQVCNKCST
jgi:hypothetical protein